MTAIGGQVTRSAFFMLFLRVFQRSIGLISTLILARILVPEDFGIVAIVTIVSLFFDILTQTGSEQYIIQKTKLDDDDLDAAFTLDVLAKAVIWLIFIACVPFISDYYDKPELSLALWVSSLALPIGALMSPKLYVLKKNLQFGAFAKLEGLRKLFSFSIVMLVLIFEQSFWAIVAGDIASIGFAVLGSYVIAPYKPKLNRAKILEQWLFSKWMLLKGIFGFARSQADTFLVSKYFGIADLGRYHMAKHIAYIPANDIVIPATEPVLSALVEAKDEMHSFRYRLSTGLLINFALIFPVSIFVYCFPELIVDFLLGDKWVSTYDVMSLLGVGVLLTSLNHLFETALIALAKVKQVFYFDAITMLVMVTVLWLYPGGNIETFTLHRNYLLVGFSLVLFSLCYYIIRFDCVRTIGLLIPIVLSTLLAVYVVGVIRVLPVAHVIFDIPLLAMTILGSIFVLVTAAVAITLYCFPFYKNLQEVKFVLAFMGKLRFGSRFNR